MAQKKESKEKATEKNNVKDIAEIEKAAKKKYMEMQMLENQIKAVQNQIQQFDSQLQEINSLKSTIKEFKETPKGKEKENEHDSVD